MGGARREIIRLHRPSPSFDVMIELDLALNSTLTLLPQIQPHGKFLGNFGMIICNEELVGSLNYFSKAGSSRKPLPGIYWAT